jgi:hypothetical protein
VFRTSLQAWDHNKIDEKKKGNVRGKVMAGGFRMELIRIGCIEIDGRILEEPWRGPRRDS